MAARTIRRDAIRLAALCSIVVFGLSTSAAAADGPSMVDPKLGVRTVTSGLVTPTAVAFLAANDMLVLEKATGRVQRVVNGQVQGTALDLAVNSGSERGLLGIALHPQFPLNPAVYL